MAVGDAHNMTLSWQGPSALSTGGQGLSGMIIVLLVTGIAVLVAGLAAIGFGIQVKEFTLGNTLILSGVISACSGLLTLGMAVVVRELTAIAWRLGPAEQETAVRARS